MSCQRPDVERDLSRKLQAEIGRIVEREIRVAQHVLDSSELTLMLIQASVALSLTTAATAAASAAQDDAVERVFDQTLTWIATMAAGDRNRSVGEVRAKRAAAA